jgi:hypothetical protein
MSARYAAAIVAYVVPSFILGLAWHLVLFAGYYERLEIYRPDIIVPFGLASMLVQASLFAWLFDKAFASRPGTWLARGLSYAAVGGLLSWSFTTLAVAAKNVMTSVPDYLIIETAFTIVQWVIVGPLTALAFAHTGSAARTEAATT